MLALLCPKGLRIGALCLPECSGAPPSAFPSSAARRRAACRSRALPHATRLLRAPPCGLRVGKVIARFARRRRPMRSRRRRSYVGHGVRIVVQGSRQSHAAAALHQLQRVLPELHQLLAGYGRERLHRGHELLHRWVVRGCHAIVPEQRLELRRRCGAKGPQHQEPQPPAAGCVLPQAAGKS